MEAPQAPGASLNNPRKAADAQQNVVKRHVHPQAWLLVVPDDDTYIN